MAKKAGARGESPISPGAVKATRVEGGGQQGLARCPVTQGPTSSVLLYISPEGAGAFLSSLLFPSSPLGSPGLPWEKGRGREFGATEQVVRSQLAQRQSSWATLGKSLCLSEPDFSSDNEDGNKSLLHGAVLNDLMCETQCPAWRQPYLCNLCLLRSAVCVNFIHSIQ